MSDPVCPNCQKPLTLKADTPVSRIFMCFECRSGPYVQRKGDAA